MKVVAFVICGLCALVTLPLAGLLLLGGGTGDPVACPTNLETSFVAAEMAMCRPPGDNDDDPPPVVDDIDALRTRAQAFADASAAGYPTPTTAPPTTTAGAHAWRPESMATPAPVTSPLTLSGAPTSEVASRSPTAPCLRQAPCSSTRPRHPVTSPST